MREFFIWDGWTDDTTSNSLRAFKQDPKLDSGMRHTNTYHVIEKKEYDKLKKDWQEADVIYSHARHLLYKAADSLIEHDSALAKDIAGFLGPGIE